MVLSSMSDFILFFFFSSRRRHTRCALVTVVQTCALPIFSSIIAPCSRYTDSRRTSLAISGDRKLSPCLALFAFKRLPNFRYFLSAVRSPPIGKSLSCRHNDSSEEHTSELQSLMRISYAVFCLQKKKYKLHPQKHTE